VNLALYYARRGYRVGLVDIDPLSDVMSLLDAENLSPEGGDGEVPRIAVLPRLDVLFPGSKLSEEERRQLYDRLFKEHIDKIDSDYDILVLDLPAGVDERENLRYAEASLVRVLVTNPEPTSHVAAGSYMKALREKEDDAEVYLWHNRYRTDTNAYFDPTAVVRNYNRNVPEEDRLPSSIGERVHHLARVPEDSSLDLLQGKPDITLNATERVQTTLEQMQRSLLRSYTSTFPTSERMKIVIADYALRMGVGSEEPDGTFLSGLADHVRSLLETRLGRSLEGDDALGEIFGEDERAALLQFETDLGADPILAGIRSCMPLLGEKANALRSTQRLFADQPYKTMDREIDRRIANILGEVNARAKAEDELRRLGSLLVFYFSAYKLFHSDSVRKVVAAFIPTRKDQRGRVVRDRYRQIKNLVEEDAEERTRYVSLVKRLHPLVSRQLSVVASTFGLGKLIFRNSEGRPQKGPYLTLFTNFLHDSVYAGLSIIVGFDYRPASVRLAEAAERILDMLPDVRKATASEAQSDRERTA
jgi:flagellar biosynthesis protein FlhG